MDPREYTGVEPSVPFRAISNHVHHTWANTFYSRPELYIQPQSIEELQKVVTLARRCRRRIATTGSGHSPSDLTMTSSWLVNLDYLDGMLDVNRRTNVVVVQAGIRLHDMGLRLKEIGLAMPNLGSIDHQSIAGAIGTATHGSSIRHGLLSKSVLALKILLANGRIVSCSSEQSQDLFRAALVSLGALGIITEVTFQAVPSFKIQWEQSLHPLDEILGDWEKFLWQKEYTRIWWMPYRKQCIKWAAEKTNKPLQNPPSGFLSGKIGFYTYHFLLYVAQWVPSIVPSLERFVISAQYGLIEGGAANTAVEEGRTGLLMNCLYSQFVNEWAVPLHKGPEVITRLSAWLNGDEESSGIPFSSKGLFVHAPIEVRVTDSSNTSPRPYLDNTVADGPTLYLNATLYRPFGADPPCKERYYEAFEWLMKQYEGKPHWAKNQQTVTKEEFHAMYPDLVDWLRVRNEVDPEGMFVGGFHQAHLLENGSREALPLAETKVAETPVSSGGLSWVGEIPGRGASSPLGSEESFDVMHKAETEKSVFIDELEDEEEAR